MLWRAETLDTIPDLLLLATEPVSNMLFPFLNTTSDTNLARRAPRRRGEFDGSREDRHRGGAAHSRDTSSFDEEDDDLESEYGGRGGGHGGRSNGGGRSGGGRGDERRSGGRHDRY